MSPSNAQETCSFTAATVLFLAYLLSIIFLTPSLNSEIKPILRNVIYNTMTLREKTCVEFRRMRHYLGRVRIKNRNMATTFVTPNADSLRALGPKGSGRNPTRL